MHKLSSLQAIAHGSDTVQYFQWRKSRGSSEKLHGAVVDHYGQEDTRVFKDVADVGLSLEKIQAICNSETKSKVAILYDWENMWALNDSQGPRNIGLNYNDIVTEYYKVFWELGINVDFVDMECEIDQYTLVVAPILYMVRNNYQDKIREFVKNGGNFILTYFSGIVNDTDLCYLGGFPGDLMDVFGIRSEEVDALFDHEVNKIKSSITGKEYTCTHICDLIHVNEAEVLAHYTTDFYEGMPALTRNSYGKGNAYYITSRNNDEFNRDFIEALINEVGIKKNLNVDLPQGVTVTKREKNGIEYLFVQNYSGEPQEIFIGLNNYKDLSKGEKVGELLNLDKYEVTVLENKL